MATTHQNRLLTPEVLAAFEGHELYSQDGKKKDAKCIAVFRIGTFAGTSSKDRRMVRTSSSMV